MYVLHNIYIYIYRERERDVYMCVYVYKQIYIVTVDIISWAPPLPCVLRAAQRVIAITYNSY